MPFNPSEQVAIANRILYMENLVAPSGHVSVFDEDTETVYINPHTASRGEIIPKHVVKLNVNNKPRDQNASRPVGEAEIHTALYRERDDVGAVLHLHPPVMTLFGISDTELVPVHIRGSVIDGSVPVLDRPDKITERADSDLMVDAMGDSNQLILRGHGAVICDRNVKRALARAMYIERNARFQLHASVLGTPQAFTQEETDRIREQNWKESSIDKRWHYYIWKARENGYLPDSW